MPVIPRRTHLQNIAVSFLSIGIILLISLQHILMPEIALAQATLTPTNSPQSAGPGQVAIFNFTLTNPDPTPQTFTLSAPGIPSGLTPTFLVNGSVSNTIVITGTGSGTFALQVAVGAGQGAGPYSVPVTATAGAITGNATAVLNVAPATPTLSPTPSLTPTVASTASLQVVGASLQYGDPGSIVTYNFTVTNLSADTRTYTFQLSSTPSPVSGALFSPTSVTVAAGQPASFQLQVSLLSGATYIGQSATLTVQVLESSTVRASTFVQVSVTTNGQTPTVTPSPSRTGTNTPTTGPSLTSTPPICRDAYEPDDDMGSAKPIELNLPQPSTAVDPNVPTHTICPTGDQDWLYFGGLSGKVYTIDITEMSPGIDLSLGLFDEAGHLLAFNDDYYNRPAPTPDARNAPQGNDTTNIRPRIQSWTAPSNGRYYIQVRDSAGRGRERASYSIVLSSESYGPTPTLIPELCRDLFEQDGLPEQARLLTSNEIQLAHTLCPQGDADWVYFFGKAGKTYFLYTDTRPYTSNNPRNNAPINKDTEAGADTILFLVDRDGVNLLDFNDDIPGGNTLDSQIEFTPSADGFYFLQVKNVGDIGNQFIRYDLTLQLCLPGQADCGRSQAQPPSPTLPPTSNGAPSTTPADFNLDATVTVTPTPTATTQTARTDGNLTAARVLTLAHFVYGPLEGLWRPDGQVAAGRP